MSLQIEKDELAEAIEMGKKQCVDVDEMSAYEINKLAIEIVTASNQYDSAWEIADKLRQISESIDYLNEN